MACLLALLPLAVVALRWRAASRTDPPRLPAYGAVLGWALLFTGSVHPILILSAVDPADGGLSVSAVFDLTLYLLPSAALLAIGTLLVWPTLGGGPTRR